MLKRLCLCLFAASLLSASQIEMRWHKAIHHLDPDFLIWLRDMFHVECFIETGTYRGQTSEIAREIFKDVHTVELSPTLYRAAVKKFETHPNVHLYYGNSAKKLPTILESVSSKPLIFLDAHYSTGTTARGPTDTPVAQELALIFDSAHPDSIILIDDFCFFTNANNRPENGMWPTADYPTAEELLSLIPPDKQIALLGDSLLIYPLDEDKVLSPLCAALTRHRFTGECDENQLRKLIKEASPQEISCLETLYRNFHKFLIKNNFDNHYIYWGSLLDD